MRIRKALFVLPNLFTVSSIFCGFYAIVQCAAGDAHPDRYYQAAVAILFAIFFDAFRRARRATDRAPRASSGPSSTAWPTSSASGWPRRSCSTSGPSQPLGFWGLFLSFALQRLRRHAAGALQRARQPPSDRPGLFRGPADSARGRHGDRAGPAQRPARTRRSSGGPWCRSILALSYLMVSNIRYRTFKETHLSRRKGVILLLLAGVALVGGSAGPTRGGFLCSHHRLHPAGNRRGWPLARNRRRRERRRAGARARAVGSATRRRGRRGRGHRDLRLGQTARRPASS